MIVNLWHESCEGTVPFDNVEEVHFDYFSDTVTIIFHDGHSEEVSLMNLESIKMSNEVIYGGIK